MNDQENDDMHIEVQGDENTDECFNEQIPSHLFSSDSDQHVDTESLKRENVDARSVGTVEGKTVTESCCKGNKPPRGISELHSVWSSSVSDII